VLTYTSRKGNPYDPNAEAPAGRGRPPQAAARRAGLEVVEKLLTSKASKD